jgi:hypothetical protein
LKTEENAKKNFDYLCVEYLKLGKKSQQLNNLKMIVFEWKKT